MSHPEIAEKNRLNSIERAALIMDFVAQSVDPVGVSDIARHLQLAKSTVHGLCETMARIDMLRRTGAVYHLGAYPLRWSAAYLERTSLVQEFHSLIEREPMLSGYTVTLSMLEQNNVVYLGCHNSHKPLGFTFQAGQRLPAVFTSTGKAMLSAMPAQERLALLADHPWPAPFTSKSVKDGAGLERQIIRWQALGYAMDEEEIRDGMVCLGAAVPSMHGRPLSGIAISMTKSEAQEPLCRSLGAQMVAFAKRLSYV